MWGFIALDPTLNHFNETHTLTTYFYRSILILFSHYAHVSHAASSGIPTKISYAFLIFLMYITCPVYIMFLDLLSLIVFGEENKL
jgi:hypothetical protein